MSDNTLSKDVVTVERIFNAPIDLIWKMWTEADIFKQWYGPKGFTVSVAEMDVRVGGKHLFCMEMQTPNGSRKMWSTGEYREVMPETRLVYTDSQADEHGNIVPSSDEVNYPTTTEVTVLLEDLGGRTKMTMKHAGVPAVEGGAGSGWEQAFDKMADYIEKIGGK